MNNGIWQKNLLLKRLISLEDPGLLIQVTEPFMDQKLILKFTMLFADNINVVLSNAISNYQLDLIFSTKQKVQLKNKLMLLNIRQNNKNKNTIPNYLKLTIWMIMILLGLSIL